MIAYLSRLISSEKKCQSLFVCVTYFRSWIDRSAIHIGWIFFNKPGLYFTKGIPMETESLNIVILLKTHFMQIKSIEVHFKKSKVLLLYFYDAHDVQSVRKNCWQKYGLFMHVCMSRTWLNPHSIVAWNGLKYQETPCSKQARNLTVTGFKPTTTYFGQMIELCCEY